MKRKKISDLKYTPEVLKHPSYDLSRPVYIHPQWREIIGTEFEDWENFLEDLESTSKENLYQIKGLGIFDRADGRSEDYRITYTGIDGYLSLSHGGTVHYRVKPTTFIPTDFLWIKDPHNDGLDPLWIPTCVLFQYENTN